MDMGIGHWALGSGHWALGIGHWALGIAVSLPHAPCARGYAPGAMPHAPCPMSHAPCPMPHAPCPMSHAPRHPLPKVPVCPDIPGVAVRQDDFTKTPVSFSPSPPWRGLRGGVQHRPEYATPTSPPHSGYFPNRLSPRAVANRQTCSVIYLRAGEQNLFISFLKYGYPNKQFQ
jgi:hypothetical protein